MSRPIEFSRNLKRQWLEETILLVKSDKGEAEIKKALGVYLAAEINSKTNARKTLAILLDLWVYPLEDVAPLRQVMLQRYEPYTADALAFHWSMMLLRYPVFVDLCSLIGKLNKVQDTFTTAWIKEAMTEEWGERTTLLNAVAKMLQTLSGIGVIGQVSSGEYEIRQLTIEDEQTIEVLARTIFLLNRRSYHEITDLFDNPVMFPFDYTVTHEMLHKFGDFSLEQFNGKIVIRV